MWRLVVALLGCAALAGLGAGVGSAALPRVAICYSDPWPTDVQSKLMGTGEFSAVDLINCATTTPSVSTLQGYSAVLLYSDNSWADATALGNNLATYVDDGGELAVATFSYNTNNGAGIGGRLVSGGYLPLTMSNETWGTELTLVADVPGSPLLNGVNSFDGGAATYHNLSSLTAGSTQIAHWSDGEPLVAVKGNVVGLNVFPVSSDAMSGFWKSNTDGAKLLADALLYVAQAPAAPSGGARGAYCTVAGNTTDSGLPLFPGTFVNLDDGQALTDPNYKGATPANFIEGIGLTCSAPPAGYSQHGYATADMNVDANTYPYYSN